MLLFAPAGRAQEVKAPRLQVSGFVPGGVRTSVTEGWVKLDFNLTNPTATDRRARVLAFYENQPDKQYGRDLWVPAHASIASWLPMGPAPSQAAATGREIQMLVYELAQGKNQLLLPGTEERIRARAVPYRQRETTTALMIDLDDELPGFGQLPAPPSPADEALTLARVVRSIGGHSEFVQLVDPQALPAWPKAFDGIDQLILAAGKIGNDPAGLEALRHWLQQGGNVWVMLDRVEPEVVTALLGETFDFQIVGRVSLSDFHVDYQPTQTGAAREALPRQQHQRPVDFVRVLLPAGKSPQYTIEGWPVWFTRTVGRGTVVFTTLGPRGLHRSRARSGEGSPFGKYPDLPVAGQALIAAAVELSDSAAKPRYPIEIFEGLLTQEIGYSVVSRGTVVLVFGLFLAGTLGLSILLLRGSPRPTLLGWVGPAAALLAAGSFVWVGTMSRRAAPPTVAYAQVVTAVAGTDEVVIDGLAAVYRPDSGPTNMGSRGGGFFELDQGGTEGQTNRLIQTDLDAWHWDSVVLPAGIRFAPFQYTARTAAPIAAVARFGPKGIEGMLHAKPFANLADGLLMSPNTRKLAVTLGPDGRFTAETADALAPGHYLAGTLLSDRQQRRQEIYQVFLKRMAEVLDRPVVVAWADPIQTPFLLAPDDARVVGSALLSVPLNLERPPPGTRVTIPAPLVEVQRLVGDKTSSLPGHSALASDMHVRFQLPPSVLPLQVERARLLAKIDARSRRVTISGQAGKTFVEVYAADNLLGPIQIDLAEERFLQLDAQGGLHLRLTLSELQKDAAREGRGRVNPDQNWTIEYFELEVVGVTAAK